MNGGKEAILGGMSYKLCLREGTFSLLLALHTWLALLWGLLLPQGEHRGNLPQEGNHHSPELASAAAERQKQLQPGSVRLLASVSSPAAQLGPCSSLLPGW